MNKPEYVKVNDKLYKINTDFRVALECNKIAEDNNIGDVERSLAIIYKLFGDSGLECENKEILLEKAIKYILFGKDKKELKINSSEKYELDFNKCEGLVKSSFKFDYGYDPYELEYLHYYDFYNDLSNLSSSEFGTCCVLSRIIMILSEDSSKIKDSKKRKELIDIQKELARKYCKEKEMSEDEKKSVLDLYNELGLMRGG